MAHNMPKWMVGTNLLNTSTAKPILRISDDDRIARPLRKITSFTDSGIESPCILFSLYPNKKCTVSSTTIPSATAEIKDVAVLNGIPARPIMPKLSIIGNRFDIMLKQPMAADLKTTNKMMLIMPVARLKL
jgi:hypothetical protein